MQPPLSRLDRAIERVVERMVAVYERAQGEMEEQARPDPAEVRRAFEALVQRPDFDVGYEEFAAQYGDEAFDREVELALRRQVR